MSPLRVGLLGNSLSGFEHEPTLRPIGTVVNHGGRQDRKGIALARGRKQVVEAVMAAKAKAVG
jgi:hypothetical protein